ncbi:MAG TPA: hypothetical protein VKT28_03285 [Puia sp.]|nr:hypothetical protein [Puia sp.]
MHFTKIDGSYGSSHTPYNFLPTYKFDSTKLEYIKDVRIYKRIASKMENQNNKLVVQWYYIITSHGMQIYEFHTQEVFDINFEDEKISDEEAARVVKSTHYFLKDSFKTRVEEFKIFRPVSDIEENAILQIASQLSAIAQSEPEF